MGLVRLRDQLTTIPLSTVLAGVFISWLLYIAGLVVSRLYLSPLAKFPGPKLAALTKWYEFYYEVALRGQYQFLINDMHKKYGPIVRVTPFELHVDESTFWDTLYNKYPKAYKYSWMNGRFGNESSIFTTCDPVLHRARRAPLNSMFSRRAIVAQEPVVQERIGAVCHKIANYQKEGRVVKLQYMWSAYACDVITTYAFGYNNDQVGSEDFKDNLHEGFLALSEFGHLALQFPWIAPLMEMLPEKWSAAMNPELGKILRLQQDLRATIARIRSEQDIAEKQPTEPTIFHEMLKSDLSEEDKNDHRLGHEAQAVIGAGLSTTAWALSVASFYVLNNPSVLAKLRKELITAIPDVNAPGAFAFSKVEPLEYLRGVVREGVRLSHGVTARMPRIVTHPIQFQEWTIPPWTPVSMTMIDVHFDPDLYPEPTTFKPERWIGNPKAPDGESMEHYWVGFGKGTRMCLGMQLAVMEMVIGLAHFFRKFEFELYETDETDVELKHDFTIPAPRLDSKGVRIRVGGVEEK